ncbi:MAG TPA: pyridoxal phosphate-dependent aminotransferase [Phycisphaerales bacterium]|nr:pyridoxal phosphate-dependent aminotransferase [Phycisphaerales bacterium]
MRLSARVNALKPSITLAMSARAAELKAKGIRVISFAAGEPDFDTPEPIKRAAIDSLMRGETKYAPIPGDAATRKVIAEKLARENGIQGITPDHVVISSGGKHSLYQVFEALIDPPGAGQRAAEVIIPVPAWISYEAHAELAGAACVEVPTTGASDYKITPEQLRGAITARSRVLVLNSPSNPCGTMYTPAEVRAIAGVVAEAARTTAPDLMIVSDELYEKIIYGGIEHLSIGSIPEVAERTVTVNGLSKAYAMTGWRVGYFACPGEFGLKLAKAVGRLQGQSTTSIPTFILPAVREAMLNGSPEIERMRQAFARRAELAYSLVSKIPGFKCPRPTGAFYLFPDVSAHYGKTSAGGKRIVAAMDFAMALLDEAHVAVVPGEDFGQGGEKCVRITFASSDDDIREGFERIRKFVEGLC